jgi:hypothetical protein
MPNSTMDRLERAVAGQLQCLVRWLVAWRALLLEPACCTSKLILSGGRITDTARASLSELGHKNLTKDNGYIWDAREPQ